MSTAFREPAQPKEPVEAPEADNSGISQDVEGLRPIEDDDDILEALGIDDNVKVLPKEDFEDLQELKSYLNSYMEEKGLSQTVRGMQKGIESLKEEMGLHEEADPQAVIKKIGSIARSWKSLSFVRDMDERKKILVKLVTASSSKEMDSIVFDEMERKRVWQQ